MNLGIKMFGIGLLVCGMSAHAAARWHDVIVCEDNFKTKIHIKTTYDRGLLPQLNTRYTLKGQGAIVEVASDESQIPGKVDVETGLDVELSRTNSFLSFWVRIISGNGQQEYRRFENDKAEVWRYEIQGIHALGVGPEKGAPQNAPQGLGNGIWKRYELSCKPG